METLILNNKQYSFKKLHGNDIKLLSTVDLEKDKQGTVLLILTLSCPEVINEITVLSNPDLKLLMSKVDEILKNVISDIKELVG